jgi:hypothetical protein
MFYMGNVVTLTLGSHKASKACKHTNSHSEMKRVGMNSHLYKFKILRCPTNLEQGSMDQTFKLRLL